MSRREHGGGSVEELVSRSECRGASVEERVSRSECRGASVEERVSRSEYESGVDLRCVHITLVPREAILSKAPPRVYTTWIMKPRNR